MSSHLAPPLPFPLNNSSARLSHLIPKGQYDPRETMRRAKLELIQDEVRESERKSERRRTRRAESIASEAQKSRRGKKSGSRMQMDLPPVSEGSPSLSSNARSPPQGILRQSFGGTEPPAPPSSSPFQTFSATIPSQDSYTRSPPPLVIRRRSSRVRFSEDPLPSVHSSPTSPSHAIEESPAIPQGIEAERGSISLAASKRVSSSSSNSGSSASAPFGAQCAYGSPLPVKKARPDSGGSEDMFQPRALPYPRLSKVLERLHTESDSLEVIIPTATTSPSRRSHDLTEHRKSDAVGSSRATSISTIPSSSNYPRDDPTSDFPASYPSSTTPFPDDELTSTHTPTDASIALIVPPRKESSPEERTPKLNRGPWLDMGPSPRSGPSPVTISGMTVAPPALPDLGKQSELFITVPHSPQVNLHLPAKDSGSIKSRRDSSIDLPPLIPRAASIKSLARYAGLGIKDGAMPNEQSTKARDIGHKRNTSDFNVDLPFPLPPDRLSLTINVGKLVTPVEGRKKAVVSPPIEHNPAYALVEEYFDGNNGEFGSFAPRPSGPKPVSAESATVTRTIQKDSSTVMESSPCPDAYSLSAAVMQVGSPSHEQPSPISIIPTKGLDEMVGAPGSPKLEDMIEQTLRARRSTVGYRLSEDESDLDPSTPLVQAALKHRIVSPKSRLLRPSSAPKAVRPRLQRLSTSSTIDLKSGFGLTRGQGWSGSESEEEEWAETIRSIALRRTSKPNLTNQSRVRTATSSSLPSMSGKKFRQSNWQSDNRYSNTSSSNSATSNFSDLSGVSTSTSSSTTMTGTTELQTPCASLDNSSAPTLLYPHTLNDATTSSSATGRFSWGGFSPMATLSKAPIESPHGFPHDIIEEEEVQEVILPQKVLKRKPSGLPMPLPTRDEEWGEPEKMIDEQVSTDEEASDSDADWYWDLKTRTLTCSTGKKEKKRELLAPAPVLMLPSSVVKDVSPPATLIALESPPIVVSPSSTSSSTTPIPTPMPAPALLSASPRPATTETKAASPPPTPSGSIPTFSSPSRIPIPGRKPVTPQPIAPATVSETPSSVAAPVSRIPTLTKRPSVPTLNKRPSQPSLPRSVSVQGTSLTATPTRLPAPPKRPLPRPPAFASLKSGPRPMPASIRTKLINTSSAVSSPSSITSPTPVPVVSPNAIKNTTTIDLTSPPFSPVLPSIPATLAPSAEIKTKATITPTTNSTHIATQSPVPTRIPVPISVEPERPALVKSESVPAPAEEPATPISMRRSSSAPIRPATPTRNASIDPASDTLAAFVARAIANAELARSRESSPVPAPAAPPPASPTRPTLSPRLPLGSRLAELIAKRDAATAARIASGFEMKKVPEPVVLPQVIIEDFEPVRQIIVEEVPLSRGELDHQRYMASNMKGKHKMGNRRVQPVCTANRFF